MEMISELKATIAVVYYGYDTNSSVWEFTHALVAWIQPETTISIKEATAAFKVAVFFLYPCKVRELIDVDNLDLSFIIQTFET